MYTSDTSSKILIAVGSARANLNERVKYLPVAKPEINYGVKAYHQQ